MDSSLIRRCDVCGYRFDVVLDVCPVDHRALSMPDPAVADLGSFRLLERVGDGGMGAVYRAVHRRLGRTVAIKLLHKELTADSGLVSRFFYEARAANTIRHEHVVEVYDFVESGDDVYFVMEYLKGADLHDAIHRLAPGSAGMALQRAGSILEQIAAALHATHARQIVHRDLKPENVFLSNKDGRSDFVKLFDFGVAKLDRADGRATIEGAILGTPEYMAPEQASGASVDGRADIYSMGCIAYEMLTRKQVFGGGTQAEILIRQMTVTPPSPRSLEPSIPPALDAAVMRALAKDPARRPQTALAFAESVADALGRDLERRSAFRAFSRPPAHAGDARARGLTLRAERRGLRRSLAGAAVVLALAGAVTGARWTRRTPPPAVAAAPVAAAAVPAVTVQLQSIPSGAEVLDEGAHRIGLTPTELVLPPGRPRRVRFQLSGFHPVEHQVDVQNDTTIAVRLDPDRPNVARRAYAPRAADARLNTASTLDPFRR